MSGFCQFLITMKSYRSIFNSLRSKRFHLVSEQRKTEEVGFLVLAAQEMKQEPKNESGERGRGRKEMLADKLLNFKNLIGSAS